MKPHKGERIDYRKTKFLRKYFNGTKWSRFIGASGMKEKIWKILLDIYNEEVRRYILKMGRKSGGKEEMV